MYTNKSFENKARHHRMTYAPFFHIFLNLNAKCDGISDGRTDGKCDHYMPTFGGIKPIYSTQFIRHRTNSGKEQLLTDRQTNRQSDSNKLSLCSGIINDYLTGKKYATTTLFCYNFFNVANI